MATSLVLLALIRTTSAFADEATKLSCIRVNEEGQVLRRTGKVIEARDLFASCAVVECPNILRQDCMTRREDAQRAIPTVRIVVTNTAGQAVATPTITVDGVARPRPRDDEPIELNPGEHNVDVGAPGYAVSSRRLALADGAKGREEIVALIASKPVETSPPDVSSQRLLAYAAGGTGLVLLGLGAYFGLAAKSTYDDASAATNCPRGPSSCNDTGIEGGKRADNQAAVATGMFIVGGLLVAGGVVLYVTSPDSRAVSIRTQLDPSMASLTARGSW